MSLPKLGEKVKFVRIDAETNEPIDGEGFVTSLFLHVDKRAQIRVQEGDKAWGIDAPATNPTDEGKQAYIDHVKSIRARADACNKAQRELVETANAEIEAMNTAYLGPPIEV